MSNLFNEIDEDLRQEKLKGIWSKYRNSIFSSIIIVALILISSESYKYLTNSKMGYVDNLIADPNYKSKDRFDIILKLMMACIKMAKKAGCLEVWAIAESRGILQRCKSLGYSVSEKKYSIISVRE